MPARGTPDNKSAPIPQIICPMCGGRMRIALAEPDEVNRLRLTFHCRCDFQYRMSDSVARELDGL
jgi:hypothetical protein